MHGLDISIPGQANLLAQWCNIFRRFYEGWYFSFGAILAGINYDGSLQIYSVDDDGSRIEFKDYFATGSGGDGATTALDICWREGLDLGQAVDLAVQAIYYASTRDSGSSDPRIAVPSVAILDREKGIVLLPKDAVDTVIEEFLERKEEHSDREPPEIKLDDLTPRRRKKTRRKK
jgi:20S proteasome alpha/beta subunit